MQNHFVELVFQNIPVARDLARSQCESNTRDELIVYIEKMRLLSRAQISVLNIFVHRQCWGFIRFTTYIKIFNFVEIFAFTFHIAYEKHAIGKKKFRADDRKIPASSRKLWNMSFLVPQELYGKLCMNSVNIYSILVTSTMNAP